MGPKLVIGVNDLKSQNPQIYSELDLEELEKLDIDPETISVRSHKKLPWICKECNNKWSADCSSRTNKKPSGCPKCGLLKRTESFKNNYLKIGINDLKSQNIKVYNELNFKELEKQGINPNKITFQNHKKYPFICSNCGNHWHTIISHRTNRIKPTGCPECGEIQRKKNFTRTTVKIGINDLESKLPEVINFWDYEKNYPIEPLKVTYRSEKKYWFRCLNGHESYLTSCCNIYQGCRCPKYAVRNGTQKRLINNFKPGVNDLVSQNIEGAKLWDYEKNYPLTPLEVFVQSNQKYWFKCLKGHSSYLTSCDCIYNGNMRPKCKSSKGEEKIRNILEKYNIEYVSQYTFKDLIGVKGHKLKFDFYLPNYKLLIEYQGSQHYDITSKSQWRYRIQNIVKYDNLKKQYCKKNKIKLLRIPYTYFDKLEEIILKIQCGIIPRFIQPQVKHTAH